MSTPLTLNKPKHPISKEELEGLVAQGLSTEQISKIKNCSLDVVRYNFRKHKVKYNKFASKLRMFSEEETKELVKMYVEKSMSSFEIAAEKGVRQSVIFNTLKRAGLKLRSLSHSHQKYDVNESYFEKIDSEEKAYFLGLLYADGNTFYRKNKWGTSYAVSISLQDEDSYLVDLLKESLFPNQNRPLEKRRNQTRLVFTNQKIFSDLVRLGCHPKKSLTLKFPSLDQVPAHLIHHFVRGYFDGDGCITQNSKTHHLQAMFNIVGSKDFSEYLFKMFIEAGIKVSIWQCKHSPKIYYIGSQKQSSHLSFFDYLYKDATIWMTRKRDKYEPIIQRIIKLQKLRNKNA